MNRWLSIEFINLVETEKFRFKLNECILNNSDKVYCKIFMERNKERKYKVFYIADEGSQVIKSLEKDFEFSKCSTSERKIITRVSGSSVNKEWMFAA